MFFSCFSRLNWLVVLALLLTPACLRAARSDAAVSAVASRSAFHPGEPADIAVVIDVPPGLHAQSHTPLDESLIPLLVKTTPAPGVTFGPPIYPAPQIVNYPQLGKVSVYTGQIVVRIPVTATAIGPVKLVGTVRYQACNESACFAPKRAPFEVDFDVVPGSQPTAAEHPELFAATLPTATPPTTQPTTQPATQPAAVSPHDIGGTPPPVASSQTVFGIDLTHAGYPLVFGAAFLIGVMFNAVPCVLPVLPLKVMGFYENSGHDRGKSLTLAAVFSLGLVASFALLGVLVIGLQVINWGGLFKSPVFTIAIVGVLVAMALNLFGLFTVNLPGGLYSLTPRHDTFVGNFLFGVLTAALSTPCTFGLFVGLLAWALSVPKWVGVFSIVTVGVGMAAPYQILAGFPGAARKFPRVGPWAEVVKQLMAFFLLATAVYFAQPLLSRFASERYFYWAMFAVIAAAGVFLVERSIRLGKTPVAWLVAAALAAVLVVPALIFTLRLTARPYQWQPFTPAALSDARSAGKPVLVDFTATWCGNCHWVEANVLNNATIVTAVKTHQVTMLKADVTADNAPALPLLAKLNPAGAIPLTAVYFPGQPGPKLLVGIYSVSDLMATLKAE